MYLYQNNLDNLIRCIYIYSYYIHVEKFTIIYTWLIFKKYQEATWRSLILLKFNNQSWNTTPSYSIFLHSKNYFCLFFPIQTNIPSARAYNSDKMAIESQVTLNPYIMSMVDPIRGEIRFPNPIPTLNNALEISVSLLTLVGNSSLTELII